MSQPIGMYIRYYIKCVEYRITKNIYIYIYINILDSIFLARLQAGRAEGRQGGDLKFPFGWAACHQKTQKTQKTPIGWAVTKKLEQITKKNAWLGRRLPIPKHKDTNNNRNLWSVGCTASSLICAAHWRRNAPMQIQYIYIYI